MREWRDSGKRGVWLSIPTEKMQLSAPAVKLGFVPHHCEKEYVMFTHWLASEENRLPASATHQVGVGVICVKPDGKLLVVRERNGPLKGTGFYKIPTGLADLGEELGEAAVREVKEETGIDCEFVGVAAFRHAHKILFGKSDLFFMVVCKPSSYEITIQEAEIEDAKWIDLNDYLKQELMQRSPLYQEMQSVIKRVVDSSDRESQAEGKIDEASSSAFMAHGTFDLGWRPGKQTIYKLR